MTRVPADAKLSPGGARDLDLVLGALGGGRSAIRELLDRLRCVPRIVAAANAKLGRPLSDDECEDVVQETLLAIWKKLRLFDGRARLETWIYPFCHFETLRRLRGRRRAPVQLEESIEGSSFEPVTSPTYDYEEHAQVLEALATLKPEMGDIIRLKLFEDMTFESIASRLEISANTAKTRYYRGVRELDRQLRQTSLQQTSGGTP